MRLPLLPSFAIASAAAVGSGAVVLALSGLGAGSWARNGIAWVIGLILAVIVRRAGRASIAAPVMLFLAATGLAATLVSADVEGVHRWIDAGPLHINMAALLLPGAIVALASIGLFTAVGGGFAAAVALLLIAQPDASQASAFLVAVAILALRDRPPIARAIATVILAVAAASAAWLRPDPLVPVAEVELIFELAASISVALAVVAAAALAAAGLSPLLVAGDRPVRTAALALASYFSATAIAPLVGAFPVPLVGLGMSFPVGFWLGIGFLEALRSAKRSSR